MTLTTTTTKNTKNKRAPTPEERFQKEWQRVTRLQQKNHRLQAEVEQFAKSAIPQIEQAEQGYCNAIYLQTQQLLNSAQRKSITQTQRAALLDWIDDNIDSLRQHPFSNHLDLQALAAEWGKQCQDFYGDEVLQGPTPDDFLAEDTDAFDEDDFDEGDIKAAFRAFMQEMGLDDDVIDEAFNSDDPDDFINQQNEQNQQHEKGIEQLLKSSSINKMFRKIASAIHPDREPEGPAREHKNQLMAQLAKARDDNDLLTIFSMYTDHVGTSPLEFIDGDIEKVITLLKNQATQLRNNQNDIIHSNPLYGAVYTRFNKGSSKKNNAAINAHIKQLQHFTFEFLNATKQIKTLKVLKEALKEKYQPDKITPYDYDDCPF